MKIAGFTIIRNAVKFDFAVVEAINSILPICDEFIVAVGDCDDGTLALVKSINSDKIKIIHTTWDENLMGKGGIIYAAETDKAFKAISADADWAFYIQSDEAVHEKYLPHIKAQMERYKNCPKTDGLLFHYKHFYGNYDYYGGSYKWYRKEIRIIKNRPDIYSYKDAQSFRKGANQKLNVRLLDAEIFHYGYVREPEKMSDKYAFQSGVYTPTETAPTFDYTKEAALLIPFKETHPAVMQARITRKNWQFSIEPAQNKHRSLKDKFKAFVEKYTGYVVGEFKNYKIIK